MADGIRVLIVDDHAVVREGLRTYLGLQDGIEIAGEAANGREAVAEAERLRPEVILMDLEMPELDGVGAMRELRRRGVECRVIVLTSFSDERRLLPAIQAGAAGYLLKDAEPREVVRAVRAAHEGETLLAPAVAARLVEAIAEPAGAPAQRLTPREQEVLELIAAGLEQADRAPARDRRENGQDPRRPRPGEARGDRPHPGGGDRRPHRPRGRLEPLLRRRS